MGEGYWSVWWFALCAIAGLMVGGVIAWLLAKERTRKELAATLEATLSRAGYGRRESRGFGRDPHRTPKTDTNSKAPGLKKTSGP